MEADKEELACTYAALLLHDEGLPITVRFCLLFCLGFRFESKKKKKRLEIMLFVTTMLRNTFFSS